MTTGSEQALADANFWHGVGTIYDHVGFTILSIVFLILLGRLIRDQLTSHDRDDDFGGPKAT